MRLASTVSLKASPSPSKDQGRITVARLSPASFITGEVTLLDPALGWTIDDLDGIRGQGHYCHHRHHPGRFQALQGLARFEVFETEHDRVQC